MRAMTGPAKMMALQRYSLKLQINRTLELSDRQNAVLHSWSYYAIFAWFDDNVALMYGALGNWLYVIRTCASLFFPTLIAPDSHTFVYAFEVWLFYDLFWIGLIFLFVSIYAASFSVLYSVLFIMFCFVLAFERWSVRWNGKWWNNERHTQWEKNSN